MIEIRALPADADLLALHNHAPERYPLLLESSSSAQFTSGASHAHLPSSALVGGWDLLLATDGSGLRLDVRGPTRRLDGAPVAGTFLDALDADWRALRLPWADSHYPFRGGWALFLAYELAAQIEPCLQLSPAEGPLPVALALRCPAAVLRDRVSGEVSAIAEAGQEALLARILADVAVASAQPPLPVWSAPACIAEDDAQRFLGGVQRIHDYLTAGDVYQVNLSRGWRARFDAPPQVAVLHTRLRSANPAPFAGLLAWDGWALASSSPERLVAVRERRVQTRPIAGTRPRLAGDDEAAKMRELIGHPKERAEHVMLIDLERNDLGRVCTPGSVEVDELMVVESYAHVHHIVSNVRGRLRAHVTPGETVRAVFPGGTITGCPKLRCMQIIAELEGAGRGAYTGALGWLNRDGDMDLNILIRSAWLHDRELVFRTGAGIVVDSVAQYELEETRAKARGLLRAIGAGAI